MGLLPQKIFIVIDLGYARHDGGERLKAGKEKLIAGQKGRLWRSLRKGLPNALFLGGELFLRSRVSPRAGEADTHAGLGSFSTAAAPPARRQQMPQSPRGRHGTGGQRKRK